LREAGGAVDDALPFGLWLMVGLEPAGVCAGAGIQKSRRGANETRRSPGVEPQIPGETQVSEFAFS